MSTIVIITQDENTINSVYPKAKFATVFDILDSPSKWQKNNIKEALKNIDLVSLSVDIDSVVNNIENLDLY